MTYREALNSVITNCNDPFAVSYAKAGLKLLQPDERYTQALYILNNIKGWRGDEANRVRTFLKNYQGQN